MIVSIVGLVLAALQAGALPTLPLDSYPPASRAAIETAHRAAAARADDAAAVGTLGMALHAWDQLEHAHACYMRARGLSPRTFDWHYLDGLALARLARHAEAVEALKAAVGLSPASVSARVKLAEALQEAGERTASRQAFEVLLNEPAAEPAAAFGLGRLALDDRRYEEAASFLERAVRLFPDFGPAHYGLAQTYRALGRRAEAQQALARHQQLGPRWPAIDDPTLARVLALKDDAATAMRRGMKLAEAGDLEGAIAAHEAALATTPPPVQAHANLISLYGRTRNWTKAEAHYRAVVAAGFNLDEAHYNFGVACLAQGRWEEAARLFGLAIEANPHHAQARNNLGQLLERERKIEAAAGQYRSAVESQPDLRIARFNLGRMLIALGKPDEAVQIMEPLATIQDAETPQHLFALATAHLRAGRKDVAIRLADDAKTLATELGQSSLAAAIERDLSRIR